MQLLRSIPSTEMPSLAADIAANEPAQPSPATIKSYFLLKQYLTYFETILPFSFGTISNRYSLLHPLSKAKFAPASNAEIPLSKLQETSLYHFLSIFLYV